MFLLFLAVGIFSVRRQRAQLRLSPDGQRELFHAWTPLVAFYIGVQVFLLAMPWVPPAGGVHAGNVSFLYATASIVSCGLLLVSALYYYVWIRVLPRRRGYAIRQERIVLRTGEVTNSLVKVPLAQVSEWDRLHDVAGRRRVYAMTGTSEDGESGGGESVKVGKQE